MTSSDAGPSGRDLLAPSERSQPGSGAWIVLVLFAVLGGLVGAMLLSQATMGVGLIAGACLLGIFGRIAQAGAHQKQIVALLQQGRV